MKKHIVKNLSVMIALILLLSMVDVASASEYSEEKLFNDDRAAALSEALYVVEMQKDIWGLDATDFTNLRLGSPVQTYTYSDDSLEPGIVMYPIMDSGNLIMWAIEIGDKFQLSTALVREINQAININEPFSLIYDRNSAYLYTNERLTLLRKSEIEDNTRSVLDPAAVSSKCFVQMQSIQTVSLSESSVLDYSHPLPRKRASMVQACNVERVLQPSGSKICWAATIACIVNYRNGTSYDAKTVAIDHCSQKEYDHSLAFDQCVIYMRDEYAPYGFAPSEAGIPTVANILDNIVCGAPLLTKWDVSSSSNYDHITCVYGVDTVAGYIYVMDPEMGFTIATVPSSSQRQYRYYGVNGVILTLTKAMYFTSWNF